MALKRECDVCGAQQDHVKAKMVGIELPLIAEWPQRPARQLDCCYACARRIHAAADRVPAGSAQEGGQA